MNSVDTRVASIQVSACRFPLEKPLVLGGLTTEYRDYTVLQVSTNGGITGIAYALSRGTPLDVILADAIAPVVLGFDALDIPQLIDRCGRALVAAGTEGLVRRAISLLDIALWDIKARVAELPLWRVLGGYRDLAPLLLVEGYHTAGENAEAFAERLLTCIKAGYTALKLANHQDPLEMRTRLTRTRERIDPSVELVVDVAWGWRDLQAAIATARSWESFDLAWIEDPFPARERTVIAELKAAVSTPIAVGDEMTSQLTAAELMADRAIDLLRVDATAIGGISGFGSVRALSELHGYQISPHVYPEIHQHCAFAWPNIRYIEMMGGNGAFDSSQVFVRQGALDFSAPGMLRAPTRPGLGIELDWEAVRRYETRTFVRTVQGP